MKITLLLDESVLGCEAKSLRNGASTLCKGLQFDQSASPYHPPKQQTNKMGNNKKQLVLIAK